MFGFKSDRFFFLLSAVLFCSPLLQGQHEHLEEPDIPGLKVTPWVLDFGKVFSGEEPVKNIVLSNTGKHPIVLRQIYSGCGCAVPRVVFSGGKEKDLSGQGAREEIGVIEPGKEARIEVRFVTAGYSGKKIHKHIDIYTDHPRAKQFKVCLEAEVVDGIVLEPKILDFGRVVRGRRTERSVLLMGEGIGPFRIASIENLPAYMSYSLEEVPRGKEGSSKDCTLRLRLSLHGDFPLGESKLILLASVLHDRVKSIRIPVKMVVEPKVVFRIDGKNMGRNLDFGVFSRDEGKTLVLRIENLVPAVPYNILEISKDDRIAESVSVEARTLVEGAKYELRITIEPGVPAGYLRGTISLLSDHPDVMEKKIRILGYAAAGEGAAREAGPAP